MKRSFLKLTAFVIAGIMMLPAMAQDDKSKNKDKEKEKKDHEQIIIRRVSGDNEKMVIEINGDNITVNGKPLSELKDGDVRVSRQKIRDAQSYYRVQGDNDLYRFLTEEANHAMLGVTTEKAEGGVRVKDVTKESAAEKIGLKEGDIINRIDETKIEDPDGLSKAIRAKKPGDKVQVSYLRDNKQQTATAELTKWKSTFKFEMGDMNFTMPKIDVNPRFDVMPRVGQTWAWNGSGPKLGLSVQDTDDGKGVKVIEVDEESNAAKAGVKVDDVIHEIDGKAVNNTDEVVKIIKESKEKNSIMLKLNRGGKTQNVEVKMPKRIKTTDI